MGDTSAQKFVVTSDILKKVTKPSIIIPDFDNPTTVKTKPNKPILPPPSISFDETGAVETKEEDVVVSTPENIVEVATTNIESEETPNAIEEKVEVQPETEVKEVVPETTPEVTTEATVEAKIETEVKDETEVKKPRRRRRTSKKKAVEESSEETSETEVESESEDEAEDEVEIDEKDTTSKVASVSTSIGRNKSLQNAVLAVVPEYEDADFDSFMEQLTSDLKKTVFDERADSGVIKVILSNLARCYDNVSKQYALVSSNLDFVADKSYGLIARQIAANSNGTTADIRKRNGLVAPETFKTSTGATVNLYALRAGLEKQAHALGTVLKQLEYKKSVVVAFLTANKQDSSNQS